MGAKDYKPKDETIIRILDEILLKGGSIKYNECTLPSSTKGDVFPYLVEAGFLEKDKEGYCITKHAMDYLRNQAKNAGTTFVDEDSRSDKIETHRIDRIERTSIPVTLDGRENKENFYCRGTAIFRAPFYCDVSDKKMAAMKGILDECVERARAGAKIHNFSNIRVNFEVKNEPSTE